MREAKRGEVLAEVHDDVARFSVVTGTPRSRPPWCGDPSAAVTCVCNTHAVHTSGHVGNLWVSGLRVRD